MSWKFYEAHVALVPITPRVRTRLAKTHTTRVGIAWEARMYSYIYIPYLPSQPTPHIILTLKLDTHVSLLLKLRLSSSMVNSSVCPRFENNWILISFPSLHYTREKSQSSYHIFVRLYPVTSTSLGLTFGTSQILEGFATLTSTLKLRADLIWIFQALIHTYIAFHYSRHDCDSQSKCTSRQARLEEYRNIEIVQIRYYWLLWNDATSGTLVILRDEKLWWDLISIGIGIGILGMETFFDYHLALAMVRYYTSVHHLIEFGREFEVWVWPSLCRCDSDSLSFVFGLHKRGDLSICSIRDSPSVGSYDAPLFFSLSSDDHLLRSLDLSVATIRSPCS